MKYLRILLVLLLLAGCTRVGETEEPVTNNEPEVKEETEVKEEKKEETQVQKKVICIDAGHQGKQNSGKEPIGPGSKTTKMKVTSGTSGKYTKKLESELNLEVALKLKEELINRGYDVVMVRKSQNVNISNKERAEIANNSNSDICIRIHADGSNNSSTNGFFILTPSQKNPYLSKKVIKESLTLTKKLLPEIEKTTKANNRGISYRDDLTGTNWSKIPTVLIEMGEMTNKKEDELLATDEYQYKMVEGISNGIDAYFKEE